MHLDDIISSGSKVFLVTRQVSEILRIVLGLLHCATCSSTHHSSLPDAGRQIPSLTLSEWEENRDKVVQMRSTLVGTAGA